jgi:hypothetical protein
LSSPISFVSENRKKLLLLEKKNIRKNIIACE